MATDNASTAGPESRKPPVRKENVKKWTRTVLDAGYTWVPNALLVKQAELGLDAVDVNILLHLACSWWKNNKPPYLSKKTIANRMRVDPSTVQRHVRAMEARKLLRRVERRGDNKSRQTNQYDLKPLVAKLHPLAVAMKKRSKKNGEAK